jgi:hypothetical protein
MFVRFNAAIMFLSSFVYICARAFRNIYFYPYRIPRYLFIILGLSSSVCVFELHYLINYLEYAKNAEITPADLEQLAIAVDPDCVENANRVLAKFKKLCTGKDCAVAQVVKRAALLSCDIKLSKA